MDRYLIEIPHSPAECSLAAAEASAHPRAGELSAATYWGCGAGTHVTWILAELSGDAEARSLVPGLLGDTARVVRVTTSAGDEQHGKEGR